MATIVTPSGFEKEEILKIPGSGSGVDTLVISGYANSLVAESNQLGGPVPAHFVLNGDDGSDSKWVRWNLHMTVGPRWKAVRDVSPSVTVAGFSFADSDEADDSGYHIDTCTWDTVGMPPPNTNLERIRLKVVIRIRGGKHYAITKLAYQLVAVGVAQQIN